MGAGSDVVAGHEAVAVDPLFDVQRRIGIELLDLICLLIKFRWIVICIFSSKGLTRRASANRPHIAGWSKPRDGKERTEERSTELDGQRDY